MITFPKLSSTNVIHKVPHSVNDHRRQRQPTLTLLRSDPNLSQVNSTANSKIIKKSDVITHGQPSQYRTTDWSVDHQPTKQPKLHQFANAQRPFNKMLEEPEERTSLHPVFGVVFCVLLLLYGCTDARKLIYRFVVAFGIESYLRSCAATRVISDTCGDFQV